jgi:hypothetical protein
MKLTDQQILNAKIALNLHQPNHEHDDCIRMAYEWLDAQTKIKRKRGDDWKHWVQHWCGRHITVDDIKVAAHLHPDVQQDGEKLNISSVKVLPAFNRLIGIDEAYSQNPHMSEDRKRSYRKFEK